MEHMIRQKIGLIRVAKVRLSGDLILTKRKQHPCRETRFKTYLSSQRAFCMKYIALILSVPVAKWMAFGSLPDAVLSNLFSSMYPIDGTNLIVKVHEWGNPCSVRKSGSRDSAIVTNGAEILVRCGEGIQVQTCGGPSWMDVSVLPGFESGDIGVDRADQETNESTIHIYQKGVVDVRFFPQRGKTYDALAGRYVDLEFPFRTIWKSDMDMCADKDKRRHRELSEKIKQKAMTILSRTKGLVREGRIMKDDDAAPGVFGVSLPMFASSSNTLVRLGDKGTVVGIRAEPAAGKAVAFVYFQNGVLQWYCEGALTANGEWKWDALVRFDDCGRMRESFHESESVKYLRLDGEGYIERADAAAFVQFRRAATDPGLLIWRDFKKRPPAGPPL